MSKFISGALLNRLAIGVLVCGLAVGSSAGFAKDSWKKKSNKTDGNSCKYQGNKGTCKGGICQIANHQIKGAGC